MQDVKQEKLCVLGVRSVLSILYARFFFKPQIALKTKAVNL